MAGIATEILKIDPSAVEREPLNRIVEVFKSEGVVVYPTDTFYALGCAHGVASAERRIYDIKSRNTRKPLSLVVSDLDMLEGLDLEIPPSFVVLSAAFWPGPLTMVFRKRGASCLEDSAGDDSLAVRIPEFPWLLSLIKLAGFPLTASSANLSGDREIDSGARAAAVFAGLADLVVDGGKTKGGLPSTILDLRPERPVILREGAVPAGEIRAYLI